MPSGKPGAVHIDEVVDGFAAVGAPVSRVSADGLLMVHNELSVSILIARCRRTQAGSLRWNIRFDTGVAPDITVAIRMDARNEAPLDFYLSPRIDRASADVRLAAENGLSLDAYRFERSIPFTSSPGASAFRWRHDGSKPCSAQRSASIPIDRINVLNPRARNRRQHREIVDNIDAIGLKRPVTVRRNPTGNGDAVLIRSGE